MYSPRLYLRDLWISLPLLMIFLIQIFIWYLLIANIRPSLEQVFLHYNIIFGVDLIGEWWKIFYLPIAGLIVLLFDYFLSFLFYKSNKFLGRLLSFAVLFFHCFLLAGVALLVRLNT